VVVSGLKKDDLEPHLQLFVGQLVSEKSKNLKAKVFHTLE